MLKNFRDTSKGCMLKAELKCGGGDGFLPLRQVKLPDTSKNAVVDMSVGLDGCRERCARNCSCTAYAGADIRAGGSGCITWSGNPVDIRTVANGPQVLFLRVPASLLDADPSTTDTTKNQHKRPIAVVVAASVGAGVLLATLCSYCIWVKKKKAAKNKRMMKRGERKDPNTRNIVGEDDEDLPLLDFKIIASATDNFAVRNKVGEGGFGAVYKGTLANGQEVAVKRLSMTSTQGITEFMNEAKLIAKLQHKNLVRLVGCCILEDERMLIYEYMRNKSLDFFIFADESKRTLLDWKARSNIILGIAKGLMYLHHDSRYKIIHRDLKASNILLDEAMNPKISDFGTARIFGADQNIEKTRRVIGTYGYMSPEYVIHGTISVKSDVFSFGVLTLEIISGVKNRGLSQNEPHRNLLSHVWKLWNEGKFLELLDATLASSCPGSQLVRWVQIALLCVQAHSADRPTMSTVVMMLASENFPLPQPKIPGFLVLETYNSSDASTTASSNEITLTAIEAR